jgi:hypothetical protein
MKKMGDQDEDASARSPEFVDQMIDAGRDRA